MMLLTPRPAHPPSLATTSFLPGSRELARPDPHAWSSPRTCISVMGSDLGVTLDTSSSSIFCSYSIYPQVLSIFLTSTTQMHPLPSSSASSVLIQTLKASYSGFLLPSCLLSHPPHTSQDNPLKT